MHPKKWLKKHGITQLSVANKMKVATSTVTRWFQGKGIDPAVIKQWKALTDGEVTADDWATIYRERMAAKKIPKIPAGEAALAFQLKAYGIAFEREYRFHPTRRWRADFYLPEHKMLIEVEGGLWLKKGGHNTPQGIMRDMEKANAAQELGYRVIRVTPAQVKSGRAIIEIKRIIGYEAI